jgi:dihydrofolate synthase/folylpolyglutamate synthase
VPGRKVWLDGGHNPDAGTAIARFFGASIESGASTSSAQADEVVTPNTARPELVEGPQRLHLVVGMLANKDPSAIVAPLADQLLSISVVPAPGHDAHSPEDFAPFTTLPIRSFAKVEDALASLPPAGDVLIAGSLYLAGEVLRLNDEIPV